MACTNCGSDEVSLCQCDDGKNSFVISTINTTIANPMTITVSNIGQHTGKWALIGQPIFIEGYGTYQVTASTSTSITVAFPPSPYVGGAAYSLGSVDYDNSGSIPSGTKISPGGSKGATGPIVGNIEEIGYGAYTTTAASYTDLITPVSIDAASLSTDGDTIKVWIKLFFNSTTTTGANARILFNGVSVTTETVSGNELTLSADLPYLEAEIIVTRASATTANVRVVSRTGPFGLGSYASESIIGILPYFVTYETLGIGGITWANVVPIAIQGKVTTVTVDTIKLAFYEIDNLQQI